MNETPAPAAAAAPAAGAAAAPSKQGSWTAAVVGVATVAAIAWMASDLPDVPAPAMVAQVAAPATGTESPASRSPPATASAQPAAVARETATPLATIASTTMVPAVTTPDMTPVSMTAPVAPSTSGAIPVAESLEPGEKVVVEKPAAPRLAATRAAPSRATRPVRAAATPRVTEDARIRAQVQQRLAANRSISGRIAVDSRGGIVHLTGYTLTASQASRAERDARRVAGVRTVRNEIRPRM